MENSFYVQRVFSSFTNRSRQKNTSSARFCSRAFTGGSPRTYLIQVSSSGKGTSSHQICQTSAASMLQRFSFRAWWLGRSSELRTHQAKAYLRGDELTGESICVCVLYQFRNGKIYWHFAVRKQCDSYQCVCKQLEALPVIFKTRGQWWRTCRSCRVSAPLPFGGRSPPWCSHHRSSLGSHLKLFTSSQSEICCPSTSSIIKPPGQFLVVKGLKFQTQDYICIV